MKWEQLPLKTKAKWELLPSKSKKLPPITDIPRDIQTPKRTPTYTPTKRPELAPAQTGSLSQILGNVISIDFEWDQTTNEIYTYCATSVKGDIIRMHVDDNQFKGDRTKFVNSILESISDYDTIIGYGITLDTDREWSKDSIDGDWKILELNSNQVKLHSKFELVHSKVRLLDPYRIFDNNAVVGLLAQNDIKYKDNSLDTVARAVLGRGKLEGVSGDNIQSESIQIKLDYCFRDSELALSLLTNNDYEMLQILYYVSNYIGLDYFTTCNSTGPYLWWKYLLRTKLKCPRLPNDVYQWVTEHFPDGIDFTGGKVFNTISGIHLNVYLYDIMSMYPTQIDVNNLCPSTVNCKCHENDPSVRVPDRIMKLVNLGLEKPRPQHYWICPNRGILPDVMKNLVAEKQEYKLRKDKKMEKAIKLLMNSGYGSLKYIDFRVADLTTAFSRDTLSGLSDRIKKLGGEILLGDTDSICFNECEDIDSITPYAKDNYGVTFKLDKFWPILFVTPLKKAYFGILKDGTVYTTTLTGMKDDRPLFFNDVLNNLIIKDYLEPFLTDPDNARIAIMKYVLNVYKELEKGCESLEFIKSKLAYTEVATKNLNKYKGKDWHKRAFDEMLNLSNNDIAVTQRRTLRGRPYKRWKLLVPSERKTKKGNITNRKVESSTTYCLDNHYKNINVQKYKDELWVCLTPVLQAMQFDIIPIVKMLDVKIKEKKAKKS